MSLVGNNRAQAIYDALNTAGSLAPLSATEKTAFLNSLKTVWGADTTYLTGNAVVQPGSLAAASGIAVSTTGTAAAQTGATTAPGSLTGTGTLS